MVRTILETVLGAIVIGIAFTIAIGIIWIVGQIGPENIYNGLMAIICIAFLLFLSNRVGHDILSDKNA